MDEDDSPAAVGLRKIVAALARQLDATRRQLLALQAQRQRKEGLLHTGRQVLEHHCAASWAGNAAATPPRATLASAAPTPAGWRISVTVEGLPPGAGITVVAVHRETTSGGCLVRQTASDGTAIVRPLSSRSDGAGDGQADVFAVVTSSVDRGALVAVLHAGRARLDAASWLRALVGSGGGGSEGLDDAATVWPHAARFLVQGSDEHAVQEALERELGCLEGARAGDGARSWRVGRAGEVRCRVDSGSIALEILGDTQDLVWAVKGEVEAALQAAAAGVGAGPPQWTIEAGVAPETALTDAVDALLAELDVLMAWVGALKARTAGDTYGGSTSPAAAQAAAVEAMMRTDRAALRVPVLSSTTNR